MVLFLQQERRKMDNAPKDFQENAFLLYTLSPF
jgi:hypothetical protein